MNEASNFSYDMTTLGIFVVALFVFLPLGLLPSLVSGLLVYALVNVLVSAIRLHAPDLKDSHLFAVTFLSIVIIGLIILVIISTISLLQDSGESFPALLRRMVEILENSRDRLPEWLLEYLPSDADALRETLIQWLRDSAGLFQVAGTELGRALAHILLGMVIGALLSLETAMVIRKHGPLTEAFAQRGRRLVLAFRNVVFAQVWISLINTAFTALYLVIVLPLFDIHLPFTKTLVLITFVAGLLPIIGNLISNTVIFIVSLSQSLVIALVSLAYLVAIHKLEYFLNASIIGTHIRAKAWEMLIAMVVMEAAFGIPGLIAAPIYYAYFKDELSAKGFLSPRD